MFTSAGNASGRTFTITGIKVGSLTGESTTETVTGASSSTAPIGIGGLQAALGPGVNTNPRFIPGSFVWKEGGSSGTTKTFHARISSFFNPQFIELCDEDSGGVSSLTAGDIIEDSAQFHISFAYVLGS